MPSFVLWCCGKAVQALRIVARTTSCFRTRIIFSFRNLSKTPYLYTWLSNFCTQLLHSRFVIFSSINQYLSALSTAPTITITTYI